MAGRYKKVDRPVHKKISLPESIVGRVDLLLFSELEGKVPHGAWQGYLLALINQDLKQRELPHADSNQGG